MKIYLSLYNEGVSLSISIMKVVCEQELIEK